MIINTEKIWKIMKNIDKLIVKNSKTEGFHTGFREMCIPHRLTIHTGNSQASDQKDQGSRPARNNT
jgi:hypothetical protein